MCRADGLSHAWGIRQDGPLFCCNRDIYQKHAMHKTDGRLKKRVRGRERKTESISRARQRGRDDRQAVRGTEGALWGSAPLPIGTGNKERWEGATSSARTDTHRVNSVKTSWARAQSSAIKMPGKVFSPWSLKVRWAPLPAWTEISGR